MIGNVLIMILLIVGWSIFGYALYKGATGDEHGKDESNKGCGKQD